MKPNILMIMVDQMRFDCLSIAGHSVVETPNLDQLALQGVRFTNAYSATPTCVPARAAVLTGMSQKSHGRVGYQDRVPYNYSHLLPEEMSQAGYHTQAVGKMHVSPTRNLCGFHNVILHDGYLHHNRMKDTPVHESFDHTDDYLPWLRERLGGHRDLTDLGLDCNASAMSRPWHLPEEYHPTNWVVTQSIDFLRRRDPSKPFFLKMSFVRPHPPFDPPQVYFDYYMGLDIDEPVIGDWANDMDEFQEGLIPTAGGGNVPKQRLKRARAAYYALIAHIDDQIGRFIQSLIEYKVYDNTVILFVSDHGELLGDHHLLRKSLAYEGSAKVPFILADPGNQLGLKKGSTCGKVVELRDIMPSLLDAANIPIPKSVEGKSILPLAKNEESGWREYLHGEHAHGRQSHHFIVNGKEKFIWYSQTGEEQFFNLEEDPYETKNLINQQAYAQRINAFRQLLIKELEEREEGYTDGMRLIVGQQPQVVLQNSKNNI
ncbi:arylsulfatase [Lederbergia galactosidilytica]|uniref:Arylsulfatase n=1 Tax=Lederbergia galactosidilytica TaxID=217031 RepID=A0A178A5L5_9BACI|nr:arylsulfatase [Lederbergia galactosidilytica]KRG10568.1 arylsulfatase [Virgibacillus soli]MBP1916516.1 arylsulfatase A-like enzyme [Lederbergia galactosidilytica]OAK75422.1 arylsulfatase [Lederbergia galactosidilytica]